MFHPILTLLLLIGLSMTTALQAQPHYPSLAADFLEAVKAKKPVETYTQQLAQAPLQALSAQLDTDAKRKTFWINVYNGFIITRLRENPDLYATKDGRDDFFTTPRVTIASQELSFDDIEHGILRRSKIKLSAGYLGKLFVDEVEKKLRVDAVDWHIHFALNCGAVACPPVEVYRVSTIDQQLGRRARAYLSSTTVYKPEEGKVYVTPLMSWFRADFGGLSGVKDILREFDLIPDGANPNLEFKDYDWSLDLDNFATRR